MPRWTTAQERRAWAPGRAANELGSIFYHGKWYSDVPKPPGYKAPKPPTKTPVPVDPTNPQPGNTTTTTTSTGGLGPGTASQLAQAAGQIEDQSLGASAYADAQPMVTSPSTTAPADADHDAAADMADDALQSFFGTGQGDAVHYHQGQTYAQTIAASSGAESNPT